MILLEYINRLPNSVDCSSLLNNTSQQNKACRYDIYKYLNELDCGKSQSYGYLSGAPCVLVKLNNVI